MDHQRRARQARATCCAPTMTRCWSAWKQPSPMIRNSRCVWTAIGDPQPARVVLDSRQRLPMAQAGAAASRPTLAMTTSPPTAGLATSASRLSRSRQMPDGGPIRARRWTLWREPGLDRVMIEGGGAWRPVFWLGPGGPDRMVPRADPARLRRTAGGGCPGLAPPGGRPTFKRLDVKPIGADLWERYERA